MHNWILNRIKSLDAHHLIRIVKYEEGLILHHHLKAVLDKQGDFECMRDVQTITHIHFAIPHENAQHSLWVLHQTRRVEAKLPDPSAHNGEWKVRNFGHFFLIMSDQGIQWGRFTSNSDSEIQYRIISEKMLDEIIMSQRHPDTLKPKPLRSHHCTTQSFADELTPLGFTIPILEVKRS